MTEILKVVGLSAGVATLLIALAIWLGKKWLLQILKLEFRKFETNQEKIIHAHQVKYSDQFKERKKAIEAMQEGIVKFNYDVRQSLATKTPENGVDPPDTAYVNWVRGPWEQKKVSFPASCDADMDALITLMEEMSATFQAMSSRTLDVQARHEQMDTARLQYKDRFEPLVNRVQSSFRGLLFAEEPA